MIQPDKSDQYKAEILFIETYTKFYSFCKKVIKESFEYGFNTPNDIAIYTTLFVKTNCVEGMKFIIKYGWDFGVQDLEIEMYEKYCKKIIKNCDDQLILMMLFISINYMYYIKNGINADDLLQEKIISLKKGIEHIVILYFDDQNNELKLICNDDHSVRNSFRQNIFWQNNFGDQHNGRDLINFKNIFDEKTLLNIRLFEIASYVTMSWSEIKKYLHNKNIVESMNKYGKLLEGKYLTVML